MVFTRDPVTNAEYIAFLDDLAARGFEERALRHVPRERMGAESAAGAPIYGFEDGRFHLRLDADGDIWLADWPVVMIDWQDARPTPPGWPSAPNAPGGCRARSSGRRPRAGWTGASTPGATTSTRPGAR